MMYGTCCIETGEILQNSSSINLKIKEILASSIKLDSTHTLSIVTNKGITPTFNTSNFEILGNLNSIKNCVPSLKELLYKCGIRIFDLDRPYYPSYFTPYNFVDISISEQISDNHLSPLNKLKLIQNVDLKPVIVPYYEQLSKTVFLREGFLLERIQCMSKLNAINSGQPGLFSDFDKAGPLSSISLIDEFLPQLEERITNLVKEKTLTER